MSEYLRALVLGLVQGLTEFLPISSDGHLELAKYILQDKSSGADSLQMTVILHLATALSTCFVFHKDIFKIVTGIFDPKDSQHREFTIKIILSMIPAAIAGLFFEDWIDIMFSGKYFFVAWMLILTGLILYITQKFHTLDGPLNYSKAFIIGIAQAIAILPGISRSGNTIATALLLNVSRNEAVRFSFLMVVPLIFGKIVKDIFSGEFGQTSYSIGAMAVGFIAAFITGLLACSWMIQIVKKMQLRYFAYYCIVIGLSFIVYFSYTSQYVIQ